MGSALVCDRQLLFAQALAAAVRSGCAGKVRVQVLTEPRQTVAAMQQSPADVLLMSVRHPENAWIEAVREVTHGWPAARVVCLVEPGDEDQARRARLAGAHQVLSRARSLQEVLAGVTAGAAADPVRTLHPPAHRRPDPPDAHLRFLTPRERETLVLLSSAHSTEEIASTLGITTATARGYVQGVLDKLGVHSRVEAVAYAARVLPTPAVRRA